MRVNIDFIWSRVGFSFLRFIASLLYSYHSHSSQTCPPPPTRTPYSSTTLACTALLPKLPLQPQLSPAKPVTHPNRSCFDCHLITHRFTSQFTSQKEGPAGGMWRGRGELSWGHRGPSILSINVGSPHKGPHDRGWVVIMLCPCLPLKVTPFLIALRDGR